MILLILIHVNDSGTDVPTNNNDKLYLISYDLLNDNISNFNGEFSIKFTWETDTYTSGYNEWINGNVTSFTNINFLFRIAQFGSFIMFDTHPSSNRILAYWNITSEETIIGKHDYIFLYDGNGQTFELYIDNVKCTNNSSNTVWITSYNGVMTDTTGYYITAGGGFFDGAGGQPNSTSGNNKIYYFEYLNSI